MPPLEFDLPIAPSTEEIGDDGGSSAAAGAALRVLISEVGDSGLTPPVALRARGGGRPAFVGVGGGFAALGRTASASRSTRSISDVVWALELPGSWPGIGVASARAAALGVGVASAFAAAIGPGVTRLVAAKAPLAGDVVARDAGFDAGDVVAREVAAAGVAAGDVVAREAAVADDVRASFAMGGADVDERVTTFGDDVRAALVEVRASGARFVVAGVPAGGVTADSFTSFASAAS